MSVKDIMMIINGEISSLFRDGINEPNKTYRTLPTIYTKNTWRLKRFVKGFFISTMNLMAEHLAYEKFFRDYDEIYTLYNGIVDFYKFHKRNNLIYETLIFDKNGKVIIEIKHKNKKIAKKIHYGLIKLISDEDLSLIDKIEQLILIFLDDFHKKD